MILLIDPPRPGWHNMAIDSALLDLAELEGVSFLRLYRWDPFCLSFGRHEPVGQEYSPARIHELGVDCVRRPTGGRTVWHARELTYAIAAPLAEFGGLRRAYRQIHELFQRALLALGGRTELAAPSGARGASPASAGPCFSAPAGGEVLMAGRKVVGSAQRRQGDAFLQHGSLLLQDDQSLVLRLAGLPGGTGADGSVSSLLGRTVRFAEAANAVTETAPSLVGPLDRASGALMQRVTTRAAVHAVRFQDATWTWQR